MDIDRCNSIFELFSAFNFAYAILSFPNGHSVKKVVNKEVKKEGSDTAEEEIVESVEFDSKSFVDMVDYHLVKPFSILNEKIDRTINDILISQNSVNTIKEITLKLNDDKKTKSCDIQFNALETQADIVRNIRDLADDEKIKAKAKIDQKFPFISFLLGLFCVSVLILAISQSPHKHFTLLCLDFALLAAYLHFIIFRNSNVHYSYLNLSRVYLISIVLCGIVHMWLPGINDAEYPKFIEKIEYIENWHNLKKIFVLFNVILPFSHFCFYFLFFNIQTAYIKFRCQNVLGMVESRVSKINAEIAKLKL